MIHPFLKQWLVHPRSPSGTLVQTSGQLLTADDGTTFPVVEGIPVMLATTGTQPDYQRHYTVDAELFDYHEARDAATDHDEARLQQSILRRVPSTAQSVLDVGCGRAWVARELCPQSVVVCSCDISLTNPLKAIQLYPSPHHVAVVADAMALPFAHSSFDCIIASEIIEHVVDPAGFLVELLRVLKPGGRLIVSTPYKEKIRYVLCVHCNQRTPIHAHLHSFDENILRSLVADQSITSHISIFGNKALLMLRSYVVLRYLPYSLWRTIDAVANLLVKKQSHIVVDWTKPAGGTAVPE